MKKQKDFIGESENVQKLVEAIKNVHDIEEVIYKLADELSHHDKRTNDILHLLEDLFSHNVKLTRKEHFVILEELQKTVVERRKVKIEVNLLNEFLKDKSFILSPKMRQKMTNKISGQLDSNMVYYYKTIKEGDNLECILPELETNTSSETQEE